MSNQVTLQVDLTELDRDRVFPLSSLFLWAQKCRVPMYSKGALLELRTTVGTLMVKAQTFRFTSKDAAPSPFETITVSQRLVHVGKTSMTLFVNFMDDSTKTIFARGMIVMVCVSEGKAREIPQRVRDMLLDESNGDKESLKGKQELDLELEAMRALFTSHNASTIPPHEVLLRVSDEDANKHVRHLKYAQFFEDAIKASEADEDVAGRRFEMMSVEYVKETIGGEICYVQTQRNGDCAKFEMTRGKDGEIVCRGIARY